MSPKRIAVIVGAGYSRVAGRPDTSQLLEADTYLVTRAQVARYQRVWDAYATWKAAAVNASGDLFLAEVEAGRVAGTDWKTVVEVIAGTVASAGVDPSSRVSPRYADSLMRPNQLPTHRAFFAEVEAAGELAGVVSLNYDLLVETVLRPHPMKRPSSPGFHYGGLPRPQICVGRSSLPFRGARDQEPLELTGTVPIWKPHGSLNWHREFVDWDRNRAHVTIYPDMRAAFRAGGDAAIIPPVARESSVPPWLADVWRGAEELLRAADEWRVAGYSLPPADVAIADMFGRATGAQSRIYIRNKTERTRARWEAIAGGVPVEFGPAL